MTPAKKSFGELYRTEARYVTGCLVAGETPSQGDTDGWIEWLLGFVDGMARRVGDTYLITQDREWLLEFRAVLTVQAALTALVAHGEAEDDGAVS